MMVSLIPVIIIEDQHNIREGLAYLLGSTPGLSVRDSFPSIEAALAASSDLEPQIALVDIGLPGKSGIEGIPMLRRKWPALQCLVLSVYDDDDRIFRAICAGACGYLLKRTPAARIIESIAEVAAGGAPVSPEVARRILDAFRKPKPAPVADLNLTAHEQRLLKLITEGHNRRTAAEQLGVTTHAIAFHLRQIYEKLHVRTQAEAVAKAMRAGLL